MSEAQQHGGVDSPKVYPSVNEQLDIIRIAFDAHLERRSQGRWLYTAPSGHKFIVSMGYVFGEATITLDAFGAVEPIDLYVGQHPIVWVLEGPWTPKPIIDTIHYELDCVGH